MTGTNGSKYDISQNGVVNTSFILASAPGSGSGKIAHALWSTELAGAPKEYFNPLNIQDFYQRWKMQDFREYLNNLKKFRTTANGLFGIKTHFPDFRAALKQCDLMQVLPELKFIYVSRRDRLEQTVAYDFTLQNGYGNVTEEDSGQSLFYDFQRLEKVRFDLLSQEREWELFFRFNDVHPLIVYYDDFKESPALVLSRIFSFLNIDVPGSLKLDFAPSNRQQQVRQRFLERYKKDKQQLEISSAI